MPGLLVASLLFGPCCHAAAGATPPPAKAVPYVAKIEFTEVRQKQTISVQTEVSGKRGTPLKIDLGGSPMRRRLKLEMQDIPGTKPTQYIAKFQWAELGKDGGIVKVLAEPTLVTTVDRTAKLITGEEKGDRIEIELTVREGVPASAQPEKTETRGGLIIGGVTPRVIIQEEEEERLGIVP